MKRNLICLLTLLSLGLNIQAQTITVDDIEALSEGETVQFKLHVSGVTAMTSMHFEVELPSGFMVSGVNATTDWAAMFSREGGVVGAISSSDNALNGEGDVAMVSVVTPNTAVGDYPVTINNIRINGIELGTTVNFNIKVVERHTVVLDENSTEAPEASGEAVNVHVLRTITAGNWSTICLPFAMTNAQVCEAFGDDVELADYTGYETEEDGGGNIIGITVNFNDVTNPAIEANHPYIIKVSSPVTEFTVDGVEVTPEASPQVSFGYTTGKGKNAVYHPSDFTGTYVADFDFYNDATSYPLFLNGNQFYYATENTQHMKAFRGYFDFDDYLAEAEGAAVKMAINIDGIFTGVNDIEEDNAAETWYNLSGCHIAKRTNTSSLPKGIYIVNGKKKAVR